MKDERGSQGEQGGRATGRGGRARGSGKVVPEPLETLFEAGEAVGEAVTLPGALATFYGTLRLAGMSGAALREPGQGGAAAREYGRPWVLANFIETLDGVAALGDDEADSGGGISGGSAQDRAVMGMLRALADAVVVGAATLRAVPRHRWTAEHIFPPFAEEYGELRRALGKAGPPLAVIVSGSGELDLSLPVFSSGEAPALIVTTAAGSERLRERGVPAGVRVGVAAQGRRGESGMGADGGRVSAAGALAAVQDALGRGAGSRAVATAAEGGEPPQHPPARVDRAEGGRRGEGAGGGEDRGSEAAGAGGDRGSEAAGAGAGGRLVLVEGGPHLLGDFYAEGLLDEQFLTLAPRVAGRATGVRRLALVEGRAFAVDRLATGRLLSVRRGGDLLFLRYGFARG